MQDALFQLFALIGKKNFKLPRLKQIPLFSKKGQCQVWWLMAACVVLAGCSTVPPQKPAPAPAPVQGIAILLSDNSPAFTGVQREIVKQYQKRIDTYSLGDDESSHPAVQKKIQSSDKPVVVAIGLPAAQVARRLTGKQVFFCQVFNYEDTDLLTPWMSGVSATPPADDQFRIWKLLYPKLKKIGVITGKKLNIFMNEAKAAAVKNGLEIVHVEVRSDKETLYAYKKLAREIQGFWLVPDNRVLSRRVIRDIMGYSVKEGIQVTVFSHQLLSLGGLLSVESNYADIAERVLARVNSTARGADTQITPLSKSTTRINTVMTKRLNLTLPKQLGNLAYAP